MGRRSRSRSDGGRGKRSRSGGKDRNRERDKEKEKDKEKDRDRDRDRDRGRDHDRKKDKDREKDRDREKEKDRDREKDREKEKDRDRSSSSESATSSSSHGRRIWPMVVATGPRTFVHLPPLIELQNVGVDPATETAALPAAPTTTMTTAGGWGQSLSAAAAAGVAASQAYVPGQKPLGRPPAAAGLALQGTGAMGQHLLTGHALAQHQGKTQICFNFTGGKCFRENCRFLHVGPGGRPAPPPALPALFSGVVG